MTASEREVERSQVLRAEYIRLCSDIRSIESNNERIIAIGMGLITAGTAYSSAVESTQFFIVAPMASTIILVYAALAYFWVYSMGGYKRHIEELINKYCGSNILIWEILAPERTRSNLSGFALQALYGVVWASVVVYSVYKVYREIGSVQALLVSFLCGILMLLVVIAAVSTHTVRQQTYKRAQELYGKS